MPRISFSSIFVSDQRRAKAFYTAILGFELAVDRPAGSNRWLAVVSDDDPSGTQLLLEPAHSASGKAYQGALFRQGIAATSFEVDDIDYEYERLVAEGVTSLA